MASTTTPTAELTATELGAWRGMLRVHAALVRELDAELDAEHELPLSSYDVLIYLRSAPGRRLRMAELADSVLLSRSGLTRLVDRLVREGLIVRDACASDGRGSFAVLTNEGEALLARARPTHLAGVRERFLRHFSENELRTLASYWERVKPGAADMLGSETSASIVDHVLGRAGGREGGSLPFSAAARAMRDERTRR